MSEIHADADTEWQKQVEILARQRFDELTRAATADDVVEILAWERTPLAAPLYRSDGYFLGETGTCQVWSALRTAGWRTAWSGGRDHYVMRAPDGSTITYEDHKIYRGDRRPTEEN